MRYVDLGSVKPVEKKTKNGRGKKVALALGSLFFIVVLIVAVVSRQGLSALLNPVSIVSNFVGDSLKETDGRTNILVLGLDRRSNQTEGGLTDTILVLSYDKDKKDAVMISLPRDLYITNYREKLNAVYATTGWGSNGFDAAKGRDEVVKTIQDILGVPIHYYAVVDFKAFEKVIDTLGGVDVNVETTFDDYFYPVEGNEGSACGRSQAEIDRLFAEGKSEYEVFSCRYMTAHFDAGLQRMDSKTALIYSRSRKGTNNEGTDFARAKRQQKVILAIRDKALSLETLSNPVKVKELYDSYNQYIDTNVGLKEIQEFYTLAKTSDVSSIKSIVLDDRSSEDSGGLLYEPEDKTLYGGQYVLIPKAGDYSQIHAHIQKLLFGE